MYAALFDKMEQELTNTSYARAIFAEGKAIRIATFSPPKEQWDHIYSFRIYDDNNVEIFRGTPRYRKFFSVSEKDPFGVVCTLYLE